MELSQKQTIWVIGLIVLVVIGMGYLLWTHTASPAPTLAPGMSPLAPMGAVKGTSAPPGGPNGFLPPAARRMANPGGSPMPAQGSR